MSPMALSMALATLYGQSLDLRTVDVTLAKGLIAAGSLLGLEAVAVSGVKSLLSGVSKETLSDVLSFALGGADASGDVDIFFAGPYPVYTKTLVQYLVDYVLATFNASENPLDPVFRDVLMSLPFPILKSICESDKLLVSGHMGRHQFACEIASARQRQARKKMAAAGGPAEGPQFEETAIMSFSNGKGKVELLRRPVGKRKVLWKAGR